MNKKLILIILTLILLLIPSLAYAAEGDELEGSVAIISDATPQYAEIISANASGITNNTGTLSYQWTRDGLDIDGAVNNSYTLAEQDIGSAVGVKVTSSVETGAIISDTVTVGKADREAPAAPILSAKDHYSITLSETGCEYKIEGGSFASDNMFTNLKSNTEYTFYQRYAESATHNASPASQSLSVTTDYVRISDTSVNISTLKNGDYVLASGNVTLSGAQSIMVKAEAGTKLTLSGAVIDASSVSNGCAIEFLGSDNQLLLSGNNTVKSGSQRAGIEVAGSLAISGSGSINAVGGTNGAGIGGGNGEGLGTVTISGGTVTARGGTNGAGIGGGNGGEGGSVSISGGYVFASGSAADDIGGGNSSSGGGALNISGTATVFLLDNKSPAPTVSNQVFRVDEKVVNSMAYGYSLPSAWTENTTAFAYIYYCTVILETGSAGSVQTEEVPIGTVMDAPDDPQRAGAYFGGWYNDAEWTDEFHAGIEKIYSDKTIYAEWEVDLTVKCGKGGSVTPNTTVRAQLGKDFTIECTPITDYYVKEITSLKSNTIIDNNDNTYTIKSLDEADTIAVVFDSYNLLGSVTIDHDGSAEYDDEVGVNTTQITNIPETLKYQWTRDGKDIWGANKETYTLTAEDIGSVIGIKVYSEEKNGALTASIAGEIKKATKAAPLAPTALIQTINSITLFKIDGCEYRMGDGEWQESNVFEGLESEKEYVFYQRYAECETHLQSNSSFSAKVFTIGYHPESIKFTHSAISMFKDEVKELNAALPYNMLPKEVQNKAVTWSSSNEKVARINSQDGTIVALREGKTTITVTCVDTKNGVFSDTCILQVYDPVEVSEETYLGSLKGKLTDSSDNPMAGYRITLYSNPITISTNSLGEYYVEYLPYTSHVLVVEDTDSNEIGRVTIKWTLGDKNNAYVDYTNGIVSLTYTETTKSIDIPIQVNAAFDAIKVKNAEEIDFVDEDQKGPIPKKVYVLVLMGIIAACIIGVGYILYIGRVGKVEYYDDEMQQDEQYYEQQLLESDSEENAEWPE